MERYNSYFVVERVIRWLILNGFFFDVGSTLMNEEKAYLHRLHDVANAVAPLSAWHTTNLIACHRINRYTDTKE